ncbi:MAG: histidinol-phosphatase HisJ family protein [Desulfobacteraceae bacterium]|jgi:histidinol-phosphatase (PHP family)|nr:MAG: histidinol-phosphatase HisJ family protein [Desulfobacteraceae bacterium]
MTMGGNPFCGVQLLPDYHIHTPLCKHAEGNTVEYLAAARALHLPEICFTDHAPAPDGYDRAHRMEAEEFEEYRRITDYVSLSSNPRVLFGIEADYYEGCEAYLKEWLPRQGFDMVLGSVHFIGGWGFDDPEQKGRWKSVDVKVAWKEYFALLSRLVTSGLFDVVAHLDLPKKFGHRLSDKDMAEAACPVLDLISGKGMGIELNTGGLRKPVKEIYPSALILSLARERNIPVCFGSDAHSPSEVGYGFASALELARSVGYSECLVMRARSKSMIPLPPSNNIHPHLSPV